MNRRTVAYLAALSLGASLPGGLAFAQYYPPGAQIYREPPPAGYRGLPPSWLVDDEDAPQAQPRTAPAPVQQAPLASAAPDVPRPPANIDPNSQAPAAAAQPGAPVTTASLPPSSALPPEDQPETGAPKALPANLQRQLVDYHTKEPAGTIVIDTANTYLYLTLGGGKALRYGIGVGREGFTWSGGERISRMKEWPDWFPPAEMIERQPYLPRMMAGGEGNPLGARALYLGNTLYRIHGTNQPSTIGQFVSSGCIRLLNEDIEDLFSRVQVGTRVVVWPGKPPEHLANTAGQPAVNGPAASAAAPANVAPGSASAAPRSSTAISSSPLPPVR